ncbi:MAG: ATP-binding protein [bacterium]|nr:ATP-binding protein [bacterium]
MFRSIRTKILVPVVILLLAIFVIVRFISLSVTEKNTQKVVIQRDTEIARISSERLSESLMQFIKILQEAAQDEVLTGSSEEVSEDFFKKYKSQLLIYDVAVFIFNEQGDIVLTNPPEFNTPEMRTTYYYEFDKVRETNRPAFSNIYLDSVSGKEVIFIGIPIIDDNGHFSGVLAGLSSLKYSMLSSLVKKILEFKAGRDSFAYIVDGNGRVISYRYDYMIGKDVSNSESVAKVLNKEIGAVITDDFDGVKVISGYAPVPGTDWGMITRERWDNISGPIRKYSNMLIVILAIEIGIIFIIILISLERIVVPVKEITKGAKTLAEGNFNSFIKIKSKDELRALAEQFNIMALELKKIYDELEDRVKMKTAELSDANSLLLNQKKELETVNEELDRFVYVASHDLKAPLRGIAASSKVLEEDYSKNFDEEGLRYLNHIRTGVKRMEKLINDLLKLSRITRIKNPYEETDVDAILKSILNRVEYDIRNFNIKMLCPASIPKIYCDPIKIAELFSNLIDNAIKFSTKNNKNQPVIEIDYDSDDEFHIFSVKDNGIGIDPKYFDKIFLSFSRLHNKDEYSGTGIGLNIVQSIAEEHNGKVTVESEPGLGAKFIFTISKKLTEKNLKERNNEQSDEV